MCRGSSCPSTLFGKSIGLAGRMLSGSRRAISGESISSLQVFPKCRGGVEMLVDEHFVPDAGCEYSLSCLQCPLPVCKYDDPVAGSPIFLDTDSSSESDIESLGKKWGFQNLGVGQAKSRS